MIFDCIEHIPTYLNLQPNLKIAFEYILSNDLSQLPLGRTDILNKKVFVSVNEYSTRTIEETKWESHREYIDIQLLLSGQEKIGFSPINKLFLWYDYDQEKDIIFYKGTGDYLTLNPKRFVVFFPQDGHQPGILVERSELVKKLVFKVHI